MIIRIARVAHGETRFGFLVDSSTRLGGEEERDWLRGIVHTRGNAGVRRSSLLIFTSSPRYFVFAIEISFASWSVRDRYLKKKKKEKRKWYSLEDVGGKILKM